MVATPSEMPKLQAVARILGSRGLMPIVMWLTDPSHAKSCIVDFWARRVVATPSEMPKLKAVARILGPKGLMPSPKLGTVTNDVRPPARNVNRFRGGLVFKAHRLVYYSTLGLRVIKRERAPTTQGASNVIPFK